MCKLSFLTLHPYHYHNKWKNTGMQFWAADRAVRHFERCSTFWIIPIWVMHPVKQHFFWILQQSFSLKSCVCTDERFLHFHFSLNLSSFEALISLISFDQTAICALLHSPWRNHARCTLIKGDLSPWTWTINDCGWLQSFGLLCWRKQPDNKPATL